MQRTQPADDGLFPAPWFGKLLLVSLLIMLNLPAIFTGTTGMDSYGFFTLDPVAERPWPLVLSVLLSTAAAATGYAVHRLLRKRQTWYAGNRYGAFHRSALLFGVPTGIAFAPLFFLTGYNDKPTALALAGIMSTCLCITATLHDRETRLDPAMVRIWFISSVAFILVFLVLCILAMLVMYLVEHVPSTGNFFWNWEFSWNDLGYPAEEFSQRHRNGLLAFTLAGSCYMTVAIGGSLLGAILAWARTGHKQAGNGLRPAGSPLHGQPGAGPDLLDDEQASPQDPPEFVVSQNGDESGISRTQYEKMLAEKGSHAPQGPAPGGQGLRNRLRPHQRKVAAPLLPRQAQGSLLAPVRLRPPSRQALHHQ